jgi:hypothetical protein
VVEVAVWERPPRIENLFPTRVYAGAPDFTIVVVGEYFDPAAAVTWNGEARTTLFVTPQHLEVMIEAADVAVEGTFEVVVINPGAGGAASSSFVVLPALPTPMVAAERWGAAEVFVSNLDGSDATNFFLGSASRVDASPIGPTLVYHTESRVYELDPGTGNHRRVTTTAENSSLGRESWARYSADGAWIYFMGETSAGATEVWRARADGTSAESVVGGPGGVGYPAPAHDGRRIVYSQLAAYDGGPLFNYDTITLTSTYLGVSGLTARWSPADDWILYLAPGWDLRAIRPDGTGGFTVLPGVDVGHGFDFSPDGNYIVATTQTGAPILISFPSGNVQNLPGLGTIGSVAMFGP